MKKYEEIKIDERIVSICRVADGANIPLDEGNRDYQEYLKWLEDNSQ